MARPLKKIFVSNTGVATASNTIAAAGSSSQKLTQGFPTGDILLHNLKIRHSGNLNLATAAAGTVLTRGGLMNIRALWFATPQHGVIINGLDGLALHVMSYYRQGVRPANSDISASTTGTPTYDYQVPLDFRDREAQRPEDTSLDMYRVSYCELTVNFGGASDYISGGTYTTETIQVLNLEMHATVDPGAIGPQDVPVWKPYLDVLRFPVNQTTTALQIGLPYGGRLVKRYLVHQRNGSTFVPLNNTVCGANDTDRLSFAVGGYNWFNRLEYLALQSENISEMQLAAGVETGCVALNFAPKDSTGFVSQELLGLNSLNGATPLTEIDIDSTSVSNGQYWIYTEAQTPIPIDAQRPKAAQPGA